MDIRQRLMIAFDMEYREHLAAMRRLSAPAAGTADLAEVFRRAHSLKGAARAVEHAAIEALAHRLESLLDLIRAGSLAMDDPAARAIHAALDAIEDVADTPDAPVDDLPAMHALDRLIATIPDPDAAPDPVPPEPPPSPPPPAIPPEAPLRPALTKAPPAAPAPPALARPASATGHETIRVRAEHLDGLMASGGRLLAQVGEQADLSRQLRALQDEVVMLRRQWERSRVDLRRRAGMAAAAGDRADPQLEAVDKMMAALGRRVGHLVRSQGASTWKMRRLVDQLQDDVRQARLVPAEEVFSGFGRMVRELAREEGKQIELTMTGLEIEADRMILQALKDPMMHVLRNAVAHGAERPDDRQRARKPPINRLAVTLSVDGTRLRLTVTDDGRGLDFQRIRAAAISSGLMSQPAAEAAAEPELARLLLRAGFSTSSTVDRLSGRGVGLSVLHETVARLQGDVEIGPNHPFGMRLEVSLPMSVVRSDLLLVNCQEQIYALPSHAIERVLRIRAEEIGTVEGRPVLKGAGAVVPLATLGALLGMDGATLTGSDGFCSVVILRTGRRRMAILVDGLVEMRQAAIQEAPPGCDPAVAGTLLLEGAPVLVLSPAVLVDGRAMTGGPVLAKTKARKEPPSILVVDDSITTRTLEKSILEAEGFRVRLAVDGLDALDSLRRERADLVISDVQMPRLDGFGLLRAIKDDPAFSTIPVIMVTSRDSEEEVRRGMELGADAYMVKQGFEQQALLDTICQFVEAP
jgi:two-component system chemotaxis sensor kinase CheA